MKHNEVINGQKIRVYDNGGKTLDRYTVIYIDQKENSALYAAVGMSQNPYHPQGFGQHCTATPGRHLGLRILFSDLPDACKHLVRADCAE